MVLAKERAVSGTICRQPAPGAMRMPPRRQDIASRRSPSRLRTNLSPASPRATTPGSSREVPTSPGGQKQRLCIRPRTCYADPRYCDLEPTPQRRRHQDAMPRIRAGWPPTCPRPPRSIIAQRILSVQDRRPHHRHGRRTHRADRHAEELLETSDIYRETYASAKQDERKRRKKSRRRPLEAVAEMSSRTRPVAGQAPSRQGNTSQTSTRREAQAT